MKYIDNFLNSITMYRLIMYGLIVISFLSIIFGFIGIFPYGGLQMLGSLIFLIFWCFVANIVISKSISAVTNTESSIITALILYLILPPANNLNDLGILFLAGFIAMLSKYILAIKRKHIFNPAAVGVLTISLLGVGGATWWVGSIYMTVANGIIGLLVVRKIRRFYLFFAFLAAALVAIFLSGVFSYANILEVFASWPILFFATIMLTEPLTTPPTRNLQMVYGAIVGMLFGSQFVVGPLRSTPELALIAGNLFSYLVSPKQKLFLKLKEKVKIAKDTYEFIFNSNTKLNFEAGQYLEWTLPIERPDNRGNRRYFTIASSPSEDEIRLGVRMSPDTSVFKKDLVEMKKGDQIIATQLSGDFTLSETSNNKLVFIAGGIGVTPFRSIIKYMIDKKINKSIVMFYTNNLEEDIAYKDLFDEASKLLDLKMVYVLTEEDKIPVNWEGEVGYLNEEIIKKYVPDFMERTFYLSGPQGMVNAYKELIQKLGVSRRNIIKDYFPGF